MTGNCAEPCQLRLATYYGAAGILGLKSQYSFRPFSRSQTVGEVSGAKIIRSPKTTLGGEF